MISELGATSTVQACVLFEALQFPGCGLEVLVQGTGQAGSTEGSEDPAWELCWSPKQRSLLAGEVVRPHQYAQ